MYVEVCECGKDFSILQFYLRNQKFHSGTISSNGGPMTSSSWSRSTGENKDIMVYYVEHPCLGKARILSLKCSK